MKKILVIEDEPMMLENTLDLLEIEGFDTVGASDGVQGVQLAIQHLPDLILCDVMMPELDGYGVLTTLRQNPDTAKLPFIFLTARVAQQDRELGLTLGANAYLTKPFTAQELLATIATQLNASL